MKTIVNYNFYILYVFQLKYVLIIESTIVAKEHD